MSKNSFLSFLPQFISFLAFTLFLGCSPQENAENSANRAYVEASQKMIECAKFFDEGKYSEALGLCLDAKKSVGEILKKYPQSSTALKIVSDSNMLIGACKYSSLFDIMAKLEVYQNEKMRPLDLAWAVSLSRAGSYELAKAALEIKPHESGDFTAENIIAIVEECAKYAANESERSKILIVLKDTIAQYAKMRSEKTLEKGDKISPLPKGKDADVLKPIEIVNSEEFLKQARRHVNLVVFDINSIDELAKLAPFARASEGKVADEFLKLLDAAEKNIDRISAPSMKQAAAEKMVGAFVEFGSEGRAFALASSIKDEKVRNAFIAKTLSEIAAQKRYSEVMEMAKVLQNHKEELYRAYGGIAHSAYLNGDSDKVAQIFENMDVSSPHLENALEAFLVSYEEYLSKNAETSPVGADIFPKYAKAWALWNFSHSASLAGADELSLELIKKSIKEALSFNWENSTAFSEYVGKTAEILMSLGKPDEAVIFLETNYPKTESSILSVYLGKIGMSLSKAGLEDLSQKAFLLASDGANPVKLAVVLQSSKMDRAMVLKILARHLPKFSNFEFQKTNNLTK